MIIIQERSCESAVPFRRRAVIDSARWVLRAFPGWRLADHQREPDRQYPLLLHYGQTYNVVATLTQTGAAPTVLSSITTPVTMPPGPVS